MDRRFHGRPPSGPRRHLATTNNNTRKVSFPNTNNTSFLTNKDQSHSSYTDQVDWEKLCSQDLWDDTPTFTHSSTWTTTTNNADTQYSMTWKEDSFDLLD